MRGQVLPITMGVKKTLDIANCSCTKNNVVAATLLANFGNINRLLNNHQESKKMLGDSLEFLLKFHGAKNLHVAKVLENLGLLYGDLGDFSKKKEYIMQAAKVFNNQLPPEHKDLKSISSELQNLEKAIRENTRKASKPLGYFIII